MTTRMLPSLPETTSPVEANGRLGVLDTPRGPLVLQALTLDVQIDELVAAVEVRQTFFNPYPEPVEATYIFPLPDRAAVTRFRMKVDGRVIDGELHERAAARELYEEAIRQGHTAAITEEERPNVFTLRVGNLLPNASAEVELTLVQPLGYDQGEATFQFPLVVAPRYIPGMSLPGESVGLGTAPDTDAVPDASRISPPVLLPGYPYPVRLAGRVKLGQGLSPTGQASLPIRHAGAEGAYEHWDLQPGSRLDRDFILRFRLASDIVRSRLVVSPDAPGAAEGTFALTVIPPQPRGGIQRPRDIVFVLDRSGSMEGWKLVAARRALGRMIDTLSSTDHFKILAFDDRVEPFPAKDLWYSGSDRERFAALEALAKIDSRGGTELARPLDDAVRLLGERNNADRVLVLITDGQVGNEDQILNHLHPRLTGLRVFTLGVDQAVNEGFLRRLAALGGGTSEVVESEDRLDAVMDRIHRRIAAPVLRDLRLEAEGLSLDPATVVPARLPDLFPGAPLVITGRCQGSAGGTIRLGATDDAGRPWTERVEAQSTAAPSLRWTWARGMVRALEDQYVCRRDPTLERRIVELSLKHGVLCRFTAFVAVDRSQVANPGGRVEQVVQPVEQPAGWAAVGGGMASPPRALGRPAVQWSMSAHAAPRPCAAPAAYRMSLNASLAPSVLGDAGQVDLTAYRRRAAELLELLQAEAHDPLRALGLMKVRLAELLEDLHSVGAPAEEVRPLEELLAGIELVASVGDASAAAELMPRCDGILRQFAEAGAPATVKPKRRWKFWA